MPYIEFIWDFDDDPNGNVRHIAEHGLSKEDVEEVVCNPLKTDVSQSSGRPIAFGHRSWDALYRGRVRGSGGGHRLSGYGV